jgi:hypothetical protein
MIDWFISFAVFIAGAAWGWLLCYRWHTKMIGEILERAGVTDDKLRTLITDLRSELPKDHEDALPDVEVKIEQHGGQLYAYRVDNDEFLGQGADRDTLLAAINEKAKTNFNMIVRKEQGGELLQK